MKTMLRFICQWGPVMKEVTGQFDDQGDENVFSVIDAVVKDVLPDGTVDIQEDSFKELMVRADLLRSPIERWDENEDEDDEDSSEGK